MASEFSNGLLTGFQFVEGIADRRERRRQADEEIGLRRAANSRAEEAFKTQQGIISDTQLRQRQTDSSNVMLARAQERGIENLEPYEIQQLEEAAAYNPNISAAIADMRLGKRDTEAIQSIAGLANRPRSLSDVATARPAPQPQAAPSDGSLSPLDAVTQGHDPALPAAENTSGTKTVHKTYLGALIPGLQLPEGAVDPHHDTVEVPAQVIDELEAAKDLPVVQRQAVVDRARASFGDGNFSASIAAAKQQQAHARDTVASYRGFVDPKDEAGADLRRLAAEDPVAASLEFFKDYNTLKKLDPNTLAIASREFKPVIDQATRQIGAQVHKLPIGANGRIQNTPETRATMKNFNEVLELGQQMSDEYRADLQASIRRGVMPVGNSELATNVANIVSNTPAPATPATNEQLRAHMTMAQRAVNSVTGGSRNLSTKQVESLGWLVKRNYISQQGFEKFLATGSFGDANSPDIKFMNFDPEKPLMRYDDRGNFEVVYAPPGKRDKFEWPSEQVNYLDKIFSPPPNATPEQNANARQMRDGFMNTLLQNPEALHLAGFPSGRINELTPQELSLLALRYGQIGPTTSAYENSWWYGTNWIHRVSMGLGFSKTPEEFAAGLNPFGTDYDEIVKKYTNQAPPPLPRTTHQTDAAKMQLAASDDETERIFALIGDSVDINNAIDEQIAAKGPPGRK